MNAIEVTEIKERAKFFAQFHSWGGEVSSKSTRVSNHYKQAEQSCISTSL